MPSFGEWKSSYVSGWKKSFDYKSKSTRIDANSFILLTIFFHFALKFLVRIIGTTIAFSLESHNLVMLLQVVSQIISIFTLLNLLGGLIAGISLFVRRLRDMGRIWLWMLLLIVPYVNLIFGIWVLATPSKTVMASSHSDSKGTAGDVKG